MNINIRNIIPEDNPKIALIIRDSLEEFKANKPGTVYFDLTTDDLHTLFQTPRSFYYIALLNNKVVGGCGIYPTPNLPEGCSELVKFYLHYDARDLGIGKNLMLKCFEKAKEMGYGQLYLESMPELGMAMGMYRKLGFQSIDHPLGNSGHYGCDIWMVKDL